MATFPSISFQLAASSTTPHAGAPVMCIPPHQYFSCRVPAANVYCVGVFKDSQDVIGANLLENFMVVFQYSPLESGSRGRPVIVRPWSMLTGNAAAMAASAVDIGSVPRWMPCCLRAQLQWMEDMDFDNCRGGRDCGVGCSLFRRILRRDATNYTKLEKPSGHTVVTHPGHPAHRDS